VDTEKVIERKQLKNGMELFLYDRSRVMAGDRWLVELQCEAFIPIDDSFWEAFADEEPELLSTIKDVLGEKLVFSTHKKRNFVDAGECEKTLQEMVQQIKSSVMEYLQKPAFPLSLFKKQYQDTRQKLLIQQQINGIEGD
jgi:hypothetical protein